MFEAKNLSVKYRFGSTALCNISFAVDDVGVFCVFGNEESGKTTLLKTIAGLLTPNSGKIFFRSKILSEIPVKERNVCLIHEDYGFFEHKSILYNLNYPQIIRGIDKEKATTHSKYISEKFEIDDELYKKINKSTDKTRLKVAFSRTALRQADIYLFDNPFKNFKKREDIFSEYFEEIKRLGENALVIYATDSLEEAMSLGRKTLILNYGIKQACADALLIKEYPPSYYVYSLLYENHSKLNGKLFYDENNALALKLQDKIFYLDKAMLLNDIFIGDVYVCLNNESSKITLYDVVSEKLIYPSKNV